MISKFFINRPRFAFVLAIIIVLLGLIAIKNLAVKEYPTLTPPKISVTAIYPGADASTLAKTVAAPLEDAINGVDNLLYMSSTASSNGVISINIYFKIGTDPNNAKIDVNNRVQTALNKLPEAVRRQGVIIRESSPDLLKVYSFYSKGNKRNSIAISNYVLVNVLDDLKRVKGVGNAMIFGAKDYSMRIWLIPDKLAEFNLTPMDVYVAISSQNEEYSAGGIANEPLKNKYSFSYPIKGDNRLKTVKQFENIIIRANQDGSSLKLKDIAKVELASENYFVNTYDKKRPAVPIGIYLSPGANALSVSKALDERLKELSKNFPSDIKYNTPYDPTIFINKSINEVIHTLIISIILVILVIYLFLGTIRATVIPVLAIPVSLIGTFAGLYALGFSINLLTLFGMLLAIGLVVDDAIVVIENVERNMRENNLPVKEATIKAMEEITSPVIAIVLVLSAVFIPASFIGGFTGKMFQQFAITISISMFLSGVVALTLTPSLCVIFLKQHSKPILPIRLFQKLFEKLTKVFTGGVKIIIKTSFLNLIIYALVIFSILHLYRKLPTGLVPYEDKGSLFVFTYLMPGSSMKATEGVVHKIEDVLMKSKYVTKEVSLVGLDIAAFSYKTDSAITFVHLTDWDKRKKPNESSFAIAKQLMGAFMRIKDAMIFAFNPPPIRGMSVTGGFEMYIQDRVGSSIQKLSFLAHKIVAEARKSKVLTKVRSTLNANVPEYKIVVDRVKAKALGVKIVDIYRTLQMTFGKGYVNDFNMFGKVFHVNLEAEGNFRDNIDDFRYVYVRSATNKLVPISSLIKIKRIVTATVLQRFNLFNAVKIIGTPAPGYTSGDAMNEIEKIAKHVLPKGYTIAWSGTSYQEKKIHKSGNLVYIFSLIFVFLILVALYESWLAPIAIMFSIPFAVLGAFLGLFLLHLENDIYLQIGIITLIGLSAKNAILIVEFAEERVKKLKMNIFDAVIDAAKTRFRPIIMTSMAFIAGSLPLVLSKGAGANSRHIIGNTVVWGMVFATIIGTFFIPLFYYLIMKLKRTK